MADNQIEEIKRKTDIVELIGEYVELKKAGSNHKGLCPFHSEKSPSFMVSPELQIFKCFGCGIGGDAFKFISELERVEFPESLKILADRAGVKLKPLSGFSGYEEKEEIYKLNFVAAEFYHYLLTSHELGQPARVYLENRGITKETAEIFKIGFAPDKPDALYSFLTKKRNYSPKLLEKAGLAVYRSLNHYDRFRARIIFPLSNHYGNVVGFSGRVIKDGGDIAKYINSPDTLTYKKGQNLFGLNITKQEIKKEGFVVVVEGEFDLLTPYQVGIKNIVAIKGSAVTTEQAQLMGRFCSQVYLALDSDFAGDQAARRGIDILRKSNLSVRVIDFEAKYKDPDEAARDDPDGLKKAIENAQSIYDFLIKSTFAKYDPSSIEGKEKISRQLSPVLGEIEDEIVRAHCIKIVAQGLMVPEDAVTKEVNKHRPNRVQTIAVQDQNSQNSSKSRRQILEEQLLSLLLQTPDPTSVGNIFQTPKSTKLFAELEEFKKDHDNFTPAEFSDKALSSELKEFLAELVFNAGKINQDGKTKEIEGLKREIHALTLRERLKEITKDISNIKDPQDHERLKNLSEELDKVGKELAQYEKEW